MVSVDVLIERVEEFLHLFVLALLRSRVLSLIGLLLLFFLGGNVNLVTLTQRFGQLERVDATTVVTDKEDGVLRVEGNVETVGLLHGTVLTEVSVLLLVEVPDKEATLVSACSEDSGGVGSPLDVTD